MLLVACVVILLALSIINKGGLYMPPSDQALHTCLLLQQGPKPDKRAERHTHTHSPLIVVTHGRCCHLGLRRVVVPKKHGLGSTCRRQPLQDLWVALTTSKQKQQSSQA